MRIALTWFPAGEYERALAMWPDLAEEWRDVAHDEYSRRLEARMRELTAHGVLIRSVAPLVVDEYLAWCVDHGYDAAADASRARYGAELERMGATTLWPPKRNDLCWCGSGRKYKACCATVGPAYSDGEI